MSYSEQEIERSSQRLQKFSIVIACGLAVLTIALFRVQIVKGAFYNERLRAQSLRSVKLPAVRGRIFDRSHECIADNRPSYNIALYFEELRREATRKRPRLQIARETTEFLSDTLRLPKVEEKDLKTHLTQKPSVAMVLWGDVGSVTMAKFSERISDLAGVDLMVSTVREYPLGAHAAHLLGYVTKDEGGGEGAEYYLQPDMTGVTGVEAALESSLRGKPGGRVAQLDVRGNIESGATEIEPEAGGDVVLTIDARYQRAMEDALAAAPMPGGRPVRGAAVLVDVTNGDVLAMASLPSYNPNWFSLGISQQQYRQLSDDPGKPFLNRPLKGTYAPGSVFKPFVMLAGLEKGVIAADSTADCGGSMQIGNRTIRCWEHRGHGHVNSTDAMRVSCDVFFYQYGIKTGIRSIKQMADTFGFGAPTGAALSESKGFIPDDEWLWRRRNERWTDGRTANVSIGQGEVSVTPLQMALATAAIANGGDLWQPRFVIQTESEGKVLEKFPPLKQRTIRATPEHFELVRRMMLDVVEARGGTGGRARVPGVHIAGKTGTAEVDRDHRRVHDTWFIAFAPYEKPRFALAVVIEEGDHGGTTAGPVAGKIFSAIFNQPFHMSNDTQSDDVD